MRGEMTRVSARRGQSSKSRIEMSVVLTLKLSTCAAGVYFCVRPQKQKSVCDYVCVRLCVCVCLGDAGETLEAKLTKAASCSIATMQNWQSIHRTGHHRSGSLAQDTHTHTLSPDQYPLCERVFVCAVMCDSSITCAL